MAKHLLIPAERSADRSWTLYDALAESKPAEHEPVLPSGKKPLELPPLKRRKLVPLIPGEEPE
ncbi:MAG: hypothetical protein HOV80_34140 [Polyangiaceae bacterium]|nr:hypothetical protein [Polyangiaceae bacterium]